MAMVTIISLLAITAAAVQNTIIAVLFTLENTVIQKHNVPDQFSSPTHPIHVRLWFFLMKKKLFHNEQTELLVAKHPSHFLATGAKSLNVYWW